MKTRIFILFSLLVTATLSVPRLLAFSPNIGANTADSALLPAGVYTATVRNPDGQGTSPTNAFTVLSSTYLPIIFGSTIIWDPRLTTLGVRHEPNPNGIWALTSAVYQNEDEAQGQHHIFFTVLDTDGQPLANVTCVVDWIGRDPTDPPTMVLTDSTGKANVPIYANLDITLLNGPYFAFIEAQSQSDIVRGMGLPEKHHVNFLLTFARK